RVEDRSAEGHRREHGASRLADRAALALGSPRRSGRRRPLVRAKAQRIELIMLRSPRMRRALVTLALALAASSANALVWPDVPQRVDRQLHSPDVQTRRQGAAELSKLGVDQAAPLLELALGDTDVDVRLSAADAAMHLRWAPATEKVLP